MRPMDEMSVIFNMCDDFPKHLTKISLSPSPAYFEKGKNITLQKCHVTILYNCYDSITRRSNLVIPIFSPFFLQLRDTKFLVLTDKRDTFSGSEDVP